MPSGQPVYWLDYPFGGSRIRGYRAGLSPQGLGQYVNLSGIYNALQRVPGPGVYVEVWGIPGWTLGNDPRRGSDVPDANGAVHITYAANKNDLMRWVLSPGRSGYATNPGRAPGFLRATGGDTGAALFVAQTSGYDFREVWSIAIVRMD